MIWFFHKGRELLHYEIRRAADPAGYELVVRRPDGEEQVERYTDASRLLERSHELQSTLVSDGWSAGSADRRSDWYWTVGGTRRTHGRADG